MKKTFSLGIFIILCGSLFSQLSCDQTLWPHVYKPERLEGEKKCISIKGTVRTVTPEKDGGYSIQIKLDAGQPTTLLNDKNISLQNGCLVIEIICAHRPIEQPDALKSCGVFENKIKVPAVGDHVQVIGTYVLDSSPGHGWKALYPVSELLELEKKR